MNCFGEYKTPGIIVNVLNPSTRREDAEEFGAFANPVNQVFWQVNYPSKETVSSIYLENCM